MTNGRLPAVIDRTSDPVVEKFLDVVASTGNSTAAARAVGTHRNSWYERAQRDPEFRRRWDAAQVLSRHHIAAEVMEKAVIATGRIVEEPVLDAQGNQVLDDDLEPVVVKKLLDYDPRILSKLLDKLVSSEDGPATIGVQVNNLMPEPPPVPPPPPRVMRLVYADQPEATALPSVTEVIQDASWEDLG